MTTTQAVVLVLASASVLTTANTLREALVRRRRIRRRGINGVRFSEAGYQVGRECRRLLKHIFAVAGIMVWVLPVPLPWGLDPTAVRTVLFGMISVALAETSVSSRRHNRKLEAVWDSEHEQSCEEMSDHPR